MNPWQDLIHPPKYRPGMALERRGRKPTGLKYQVAEMIEERGACTADDLWPDLPHVSRHQVVQALQNAEATGLIVLLQNGRTIGGPHGGRTPALYGPVPDSDD